MMTQMMKSHSELKIAMLSTFERVVEVGGLCKYDI